MKRARKHPERSEPPRVRGIAEVDPEPMTQIAGEGIDRDANRNAHAKVREQRAKLPKKR